MVQEKFNYGLTHSSRRFAFVLSFFAMFWGLSIPCSRLDAEVFDLAITDGYLISTVLR